MKMQQKIIRQFTDIIFPFHYDMDNVRISKASYTNAKGKNISLFEQFSQESHQLRRGLAELMEMEGGSAKIANCYRMSYNARAYFGLPRLALTKEVIAVDIVLYQTAQIGIFEVEKSDAGFKKIDLDL